MAYIVGCGQTPMGAFKRSPSSLLHEATVRALLDANRNSTSGGSPPLQFSDVDALLTVPIIAEPRLMLAHLIATELGLLDKPRPNGRPPLYCKTIDTGGAGPVAMVREAMDLIRSGSAQLVMLVCGDTLASMSIKSFAGRSTANKNPLPLQLYDDFAQWHMAQYGTTREQLAMVSSFMSYQASKHPGAMSKKQLSVDDVINAPNVGGQVTGLFECARRADGAACVLVASAGFVEARRAQLLQRAVYVAACAESSGSFYMPAALTKLQSVHGSTVAQAGSLKLNGDGGTSTPFPMDLKYEDQPHKKSDLSKDWFSLPHAVSSAYRQANVGPNDIQYFSLYDCFPVCFIKAVEDVGLAPQGAGGKWVESALQRIKANPSEVIPVNTHGGLLAQGAPFEAPAMFGLIEAVLQLRGEANNRQVVGTNRALVYGNGGIFSAAAVAILERPTSLLSSSASATPLPASIRPPPIHTRMTRMFNCDYPIFLAGMGGVSRSKLVVAVSEAGGVGCLGSPFNLKVLKSELSEIQRATKKPFALNALSFYKNVEQQVQIGIECGIKAFIMGLGVPKSLVDLCHSHGVLVGNMCGTVRHAVAGMNAGCDFVIAQGAGAGGHTGKIDLMPLLPQIVDAVGSKMVVLAAGGIGDGRGLAAALALGADGVWVGTRFLASVEANTVPFYKEKLLTATEESTVVTKQYTGKTCRVLNNSYVRENESKGRAALPILDSLKRAKADGAYHLDNPDPNAKDVDPDKEMMPCGQIIGMIDSILPAQQIVHSMVEQCHRVVSTISEKFSVPRSRL